MNILYEDNHLLVAVKPKNMPVQADASGDMDMLTALKAYIKQKYQKPGEAYLGLVHRLDRPVGGVVAFAKTSKAAQRLSKQLQTHEMGREYLCVAEGETQAEGTLTHDLLKDERTNTSRAVPPETKGAKRAELRFERLDCRENLSLLAVRLMTGRSHQIRVQLSEIGHPLWGDIRYGNGKPGMSIALYALSLTLIHPTKGESMRFLAPIPSGSPFDLFADVLLGRYGL